MATIPIAPRADNDGGTLGKAARRWSGVYMQTAYIYGSITDDITTVTITDALDVLDRMKGITAVEATQLLNID